MNSAIIGPLKDKPRYYITPDNEMIQKSDSPAFPNHLNIVAKIMGLILPKAKGGKRRCSTRKIQKKRRRGTMKTKYR